MDNRLKALQKAYKEALGTADAIRKPYANTAGTMDDDETKRFDEALAEADKLEIAIEQERKALARNKFENEPVEDMVHGATGKAIDEVSVAQVKAFRTFLTEGQNSSKFLAMQAELKAAMQADLDTAGGYLVAPQVFVEQLLQNVDDIVQIRQFATKFPLPAAQSLGVPSLDADMGDADWTVELATGSEDTATAFGKRELRPHPFAKRVKISNTLLRVALMDPEAHVRERLAYKFAVTEEKGFLTGSGANQPLGLFTASAQGVPTTQDYTVGTTTAITADGLIDVQHGLKPQYWPKAKWVMHRDVVKAIRKLKDGNGQYLWQPGLTGGIPNTILDSAYIVSEFAPNTFTTGLYLALYGDLSAYWIADALGLTVQRVTELYAETNQTGFIGRAEADGMPVLSEAFVRAKLA